MKHLLNRRAFDRAAAATTAMMQIMTTVPSHQQMYEAIEAFLRDEFADSERQVAAERDLRS